MYHLFTSLCLLFFPLALISQISQAGHPIGITHPNLPLLRATAVMPAINVEALLAEDELASGKGLPPRFGFSHQVSFNTENSGQWDELPNGTRLWRLAIRSRAAKSMNLLFDKFWLPKEGRLFIYSEDKSQVLGAFTHINHKPDSAFGTGILKGESIIVEYQEPEKVRTRGIISINTVVHGYQSLFAEGSSRGFGDAGACHVNVNCSPYMSTWGDEASAVALILVNGNRLCSGVLVNNARQDCTPYVLTGHHCLQGYDAVTNPIASNWSFIWHYESRNCSNIDGPINISTNGAIVVANSPASDFALLRLVEDPNDTLAQYDVPLAGWSRSNTAPTRAISIHHPRGDIKKISVEQQAPTSAGYLTLSGQTHWRVADWDVGTTEPGSSGAPLFDPNGRVIGHLHGGNAACVGSADNGQADWFGKLAYDWNNNGATDPRRRLRSWLDPDSTGLVSVNAKRCSTPHIFFSATNGSLKESSKSANASIPCFPYEEIPIELRISSAPSADAFVYIHTTGSSASEGPNQDFEVFPDTLVFPAGLKSTQILTVRVFNDAYVEHTETVVLTYGLSTTGNATAGPQNQVFTLEIVDNDAEPKDNRMFLLNENFNGLGLPPGWSISTQDSTSDGFRFGDAGSLSGGLWGIPPHDGRMAATNDDACYSCNKRNDKLITPPLNLQNVQQPELRFDAFFEGLAAGTLREIAQVEASTDGGQSWTNLFSLPGQNSWTTYQVDLSAYTGSPNLLLAFRYNDQGRWLYGLAIDNVEVTRKGIEVQTTPNVGMGDTQYLGPWSTVHFFDPISRRIMLSLQNLSGHDFGCTQVEVDRADPQLLQPAHPFSNFSPANYLAAKTFSITHQYPSPNAVYQASLYYSDAEIAAWENATGQLRSNLEVAAADTSLTAIVPATYNQYSVQTAAAGLASLDSAVVVSAPVTGIVQGLGTGVINTPLPVKLLDFAGSLAQEGILLKWHTGEEGNNDFFTLKRQGRNGEFEPLGRFPSYGDKSDYAFLDTIPEQGKNLYRLEQTDRDGISRSLGLTEVLWHPQEWVSLYANPAGEILTLSFSLNLQGPIVVEILSLEGKAIHNKHFAANSSIILDLTFLPRGLYLIRVTRGDRSQVFKFSRSG